MVVYRAVGKIAPRRGATDEKDARQRAARASGYGRFLHDL